MKKLLPPTSDYIFKRIFGDQKNEKVLISFLNAIVKPKPLIKQVKVINGEITKEVKAGKESRLDVKAELENGAKVNIEIQIGNQFNMIPRTLFYWSKMYADQIKSGQNYSKLKKAICINILGFNLLDDEPEAHNKYLILNEKSGNKLADLLELHFLELKKIPRLTLEELKQNLDIAWLEFLNKPTGERINQLSQEINEFDQASQTLEVLSLDDEAKLIYEAREKYIKDHSSNVEEAKLEGLEQGLRQGLEQGEKNKQIEIAKKSLQANIDIAVIQNITGLSIDEIKKINLSNC